tara:strand:+ start:11510 stop:12391 length:882 start_codon:yes stop_codon:yes gene_type:complete
MKSIWSQVYRPSLSEIVGQPHLKVEDGMNPELQHSLLYSETPGVGKTSYALAVADALGWPIHIFNASTKRERGIDFVQDDLLPLTTIGNQNQIILLDEADQLTPAAQAALKGVIENAQGYFILTCNNLGKISDYLISRCRLIEFLPINDEDMYERLSYIAGREGVEITDSHLAAIISHHAGDLRNAINALQYYSVCPDPAGFIASFVSAVPDAATFLRLCFKDKDFDSSLALLTPYSTQEAIRTVFNYAVEEKGNWNSKMRVVEAAITSERDLQIGLSSEIVKANFVRMCLTI